MVIYVNYGKKLYQLRDRYGKTNIEISNLIKISDSLYSRYEKEEQTTIPIKHLDTLTTILMSQLIIYLDLLILKNIKI